MCFAPEHKGRLVGATCSVLAGAAWVPLDPKVLMSLYDAVNLIGDSKKFWDTLSYQDLELVFSTNFYS